MEVVDTNSLNNSFRGIYQAKPQARVFATHQPNAELAAPDLTSPKFCPDPQITGGETSPKANLTSGVGENDLVPVSLSLPLQCR